MSTLNEKLSKLRHDGHITDEEYKEFKEIISLNKQYKYERDAAIGQLKSIKYELGQKF